MAGEWHLVASTDDIEEEDVLGVNVEGTAVAVYNVRGEFYATENICTHAFAFLSEGVVIDDIIECPVHQGRFHIPTGAPKGAPCPSPSTPMPPRSRTARSTSGWTARAHSATRKVR